MDRVDLDRASCSRGGVGGCGSVSVGRSLEAHLSLGSLVLLTDLIGTSLRREGRDITRRG